MVKIVTPGIRRVYQPLTATCDLIVEGGSLHQIFRPDTDEYSPDRGVSPLTITPVIRIFDPAGVYQSGAIANAMLGTAKWQAGGVSVSGNPDYVINAEVTDKKGRLTVFKNVRAGQTLTLEFEGVIPDIRNNTALKVNGSVMLITNAVSREKITVEIDTPATLLYNPFSSPAYQKITATVFLADTILPDAQKKIWWYKRNNSTLAVIGEDDIEYLSGQGTTSLTVDCRYVNVKADYRVVADYIKPGDVAPAEPSARAGFRDFTIRRFIPKYTAEVQSYGDITAKQEFIPASLRLIVDGVKIAKPESVVKVRWYTVDKLGVTRYYNYGTQANITTTSLDMVSGVSVGAEVDDKGGMKPLSFSGVILTLGGKTISI